MHHNQHTNGGRSIDNNRSNIQKAKRLAYVFGVGTLLVSLLVIVGMSGGAAAHPGHDYDASNSGTYQHTSPNYEEGVEDHGWYPADGVQEGVLSDGYGGGMGGL